MAHSDPDKKREYERNWYRDNPERQEAVKARRRQIRDENVERVRQILRAHKCVDCGFSDWRVLEFDHVTDDKVTGVMQMARNGVSWKRIEEEIAKCEVRCCNCHRIITWERSHGSEV